DLWVSDLAPGSVPKNLTASYDYDVAGGIGGDQSAPRGQNRKPIVWSADGNSLVVVTAEKGNSNLKRVSIATSAMESITEGTRDVVAFSASRDAATLAATLSTQTTTGDIAIVTGARATPRQITHVNDELFKD